jgi:hypothetical protein
MRQLKYYLAGAWVDAARLVGCRQRLTEIGFECTSQWLEFSLSGRPYTIDSTGMQREARRDYADIDRAHFMILDTFGSSKGGREWEGGYCIGKGKRVMRVGPAVTPFHQLPLSFDSWDALIAHLATALEHADVRQN